MDSFWNDEWIKAWSAFRAPESANPWAAALEQWWRDAAPGAESGQGYEVFERIMNQGRAFFALTEPFGQPGDNAAAADWRASIKTGLDQLKRQFDKPQAASAALWQLPLDHWQRMASMLNGLPGDYLRSLARGMSLDGPPEPLDHFLSAPGVGYTREFQEQYRKFVKLTIDYQQAHKHYVDAYMDMGKESVDLLSARVQERAAPVPSVRALYDMWVDCSEEVYGERVRTQDYAAMHGRLINASMALKHHGSQMMEEYSDALNLPTRTEIDTLHARYQQTRRREHALRVELKETQQQLRELGDVPGQAKAATKRKGSTKKNTKKKKAEK